MSTVDISNKGNLINNTYYPLVNVLPEENYDSICDIQLIINGIKFFCKEYIDRNSIVRSCNNIDDGIYIDFSYNNDYIRLKRDNTLFNTTNLDEIIIKY